MDFAPASAKAAAAKPIYAKSIIDEADKDGGNAILHTFKSNVDAKRVQHAIVPKSSAFIFKMKTLLIY